ncbi:MAG: tRNA lysidine(34) synthetase TilS [Bryobacteraceae bacterium]|jgi:tRNA(Ile)-lysidine synthase
MAWQEIITSAIDRHAMLRFGRRIGVAVSGGSDSVFLLHALHEMNLAAAVLHVNHRLRGDESDGDEGFVGALAAELGLPLYAATLPVGEGNIEQEARRARYRFFADCMANGSCDAVATGHTMDDQAETVLSRFLRGAGSAGLSAILPVTESRIVRPLLDLRREDIRYRLAVQNIAWREDQSNSNTDFLRNRIRLETMPQLVGLNPALPSVLASTAEWARAEEEYWTAELNRLEPGYLQFDREAVLIRTGPFLTLPLAAVRRLLRRGIERVNGGLRGIDFRHVEAIRALMETREGSGRIQLPGLDIYRSFDWLRFAPIGYDSRLPRDFEIELRIPGLTEVPERRLTMEMELVSNVPVYNSQMDALDWEKCGGSPVLRNWRPGDSYTPKDHSSPEKIKTLFQENRIPLWERRTWPVVVGGNAGGGSILWTRRFGVAAEVAATAESRQILLIRESRESNSTLSTSKEAERARMKEPVARGQGPDERGAEVL